MNYNFTHLLRYLYYQPSKQASIFRLLRLYPTGVVVSAIKKKYISPFNVNGTTYYKLTSRGFKSVVDFNRH